MHKMRYKVHFNIFLFCILFMKVIDSDAVPCDSCGNECASACGTKNFRTCCFNYLRKRMDPNVLKHVSSNRHMIDFLLLHGRALITQNERTRNPVMQQRLLHLKGLQRNGTMMDITGLQTYYG